MIPRTIAEISPAWLTQTLRKYGCITKATITAVNAQVIGQEVGFLDGLARLHLTYDHDEGGAPSSVVVKIPSGEAARMRFSMADNGCCGTTVAEGVLNKLAWSCMQGRIWVFDVCVGEWPIACQTEPHRQQRPCWHILIERRGNGKGRKANGQKTGHQVSQPAQEVTEGQNPVKAGEKEVTTPSDHGFSFAKRSQQLRLVVPQGCAWCGPLFPLPTGVAWSVTALASRSARPAWFGWKARNVTTAPRKSSTYSACTLSQRRASASRRFVYPSVDRSASSAAVHCRGGLVPFQTQRVPASRLGLRKAPEGHLVLPFFCTKQEPSKHPHGLFCQ
jgi:hypothetical protein